MNDEEHFDFKSVSEEPEDLSKKLVSCPHCKKPIPEDALRCLYCGEKANSSSGAMGRLSSSKIITGIISLILILVFLLWFFK